MVTMEMDILTKPVKDMTDEEIKNTKAWAQAKGLPLAGALDENALLAITRTMLREVRVVSSKNALSSEALAFIKGAAEKGIKLPEGGRFIIFADGTSEVRGPVKAGGSRLFRWTPAKHYPSLIGKTYKKTLAQTAGDRAGDYSLAVNSALATRQDVPFSLVLTSPNGTKVSYPAVNRGKPTANEVEDLDALIQSSQWAKKVNVARAFDLHNDEAFAEERAEHEEGDEEADVDEESIDALV